MLKKKLVKMVESEYIFTPWNYQQVIGLLTFLLLTKLNCVKGDLPAFACLRGSLSKSVPLDFGLENTFALYFYHQHYYPS